MIIKITTEFDAVTGDIELVDYEDTDLKKFPKTLTLTTYPFLAIDFADKREGVEYLDLKKLNRFDPTSVPRHIINYSWLEFYLSLLEKYKLEEFLNKI